MKILKLKDLQTFNNCLSTFEQLKEDLSKAFKNYFLKKYDHHIYNTQGTKKTKTSRSIFNWNDMKKKIKCSLEITQKNFITLLKCYFFRK